jgi:hypothetical protein
VYVASLISVSGNRGSDLRAPNSCCRLMAEFLCFEPNSTLRCGRIFRVDVSSPMAPHTKVAKFSPVGAMGEETSTRKIRLLSDARRQFYQVQSQTLNS